MKFKYNLLLFIFIASLSISCKQQKADGIIIGSNLLEMQDYTSNKKLRYLIIKTLNNEQQTLIELTDYECGGASGCYDLGYVLTQIISRMGENNFIKLVSGLNKEQKQSVHLLIMAGLEYGDNNYDGTMDNASISQVFPALEKVLNE